MLLDMSIHQVLKLETGREREWVLGMLYDCRLAALVKQMAVNYL